MKKLFLVLVLTLVGGVWACASSVATSQAPQVDRWKAYQGCNERQCASWKSGCITDCTNAGGDSQKCKNECQGQYEKCKEDCPGV
jgi:hypothetical protein